MDKIMDKPNKKNNNKLSEIFDMLEELREADHPDYPESGHENLVCIIAVSAVGEIRLVDTINYDKAIDYYIEEGKELTGYDLDVVTKKGNCYYFEESGMGAYGNDLEFDSIKSWKEKLGGK